MASSVTPASVAILKFAAQSVERWIEWMSPSRPEFRSIQQHLTGAPSVESALFFQSLLLVTLSMFEGVGVPSVSGLTEQPDGVIIRWKSRSHDIIRWGAVDADFFQWIKTAVQKQIIPFDGPPPKTSIPSGFLESIEKRLTYFQSALTITKSSLTRLRHADSVSIDTDIEPIFLFVLISCLPLDQLNALFLLIQQHLPAGLHVRTTDGKPVAVDLIFQPSSDMRFMIEKTNFYMDLCLSPGLPIIREIALAKTAEFFKKQLAISTVRQHITDAIDSITGTQITPRHHLYDLCIQMIHRVQTQ